MSKGLIFFCCACAILLFTIINLSVGPIISGNVGRSWGLLNCASISDTIDTLKEGGASDDDLKYAQKWELDRCKREKGMHDMEYTSFIFDIVIGFVCSLLGLLHLFEVKKEYVSKTGLIGLCCGFVGFVFSFVYVILNGIVYTNYYDDDTIYKRDSKGAFAELENNKYKCFYFDEIGNTHAIVAKYSDLIQKQYNYNKDLKNAFDSSTSEERLCSYSPSGCANDEFLNVNRAFNGKPCKYLYVRYTFTEITNKDISDRFLTTLLLSLFVCLANIGLALFGFLLFKNPNDF